METDYIGANSVSNLIEITGLKKFIIARIGTHKNNVPVFEHIENSSNEKAVNRFREWASLTDNNLPYEMTLFNSVEDSESIGEEVRNKKSGKVLKFTFCLNKKENFIPVPNPVQSNPNVTEAIENALMKFQMKNNDNEVMKRLEALDLKINGYIESDEDEDQDADSMGGLSLNNPNIINLISLLSTTIFSISPRFSRM